MEKEVRIFKITDFQELKNNSWSGAITTLETIEQHNLEQEFLDIINEIIDIYDNGIEETQLNDLLWFDTDFLGEQLGIEL